MDQFETIIKEFENFVDGKVKSMQEIEWWFLKYLNFYKETHKSYYGQYLYELPDGTILRDAPILNPNYLKDFLNLCEALEKIYDLYKKEKYCKDELSEYQIIKDSRNLLKKWVIKNEQFAGRELACFWVDYLDYSSIAEEIVHLLIFLNIKPKIKVLVQKEDFKSLIKYKELFDELYYVQELYPEGLKRIEEGINK